MSISALLDQMFRARVIVSDDKLGPLLRRQAGSHRPADLLDAVVISADQVRAIVEGWRTSIGRQSALFRKHAIGTLELLPTGCLYEHLARPEWKRAAFACEILRHPSISKNSGWLDTRSVQARLTAATLHEAPVRIVIGWGQPKRDAAGLKTAGPFADLAEAYAIARLGIIVDAMAALLAYPVQITVLSGGERFGAALFTDPDLCSRYDDQRQDIADVLFGPGTITFVDYIRQLTYGQLHERRLQYLAALESVTDEMIAAQFDTVLMNVEWCRVFALGAAEDAPHGHTLPASVRHWADGHPPSDLVLLIRAALCSIVTPRRQADWQKTLHDTEDIIQDAVAFMRAVAWESTRKYIALHAADAALERGGDRIDHSDAPIRLTVHQKRDRPDIPAVFTLGPDGGDALSQHVMARLEPRGRIRFETLTEIRMHPARPVMVGTCRQQDGPILFGWLTDTEQPLCFVDATDRNTCDLLASALDH
jgi:hypothetical protein